MAAAPAPAIENRAVKGPIGPPPGLPLELPPDPRRKAPDGLVEVGFLGAAGAVV